jgi:hypothetical protein
MKSMMCNPNGTICPRRVAGLGLVIVDIALTILQLDTSHYYAMFGAALIGLTTFDLFKK